MLHDPHRPEDVLKVDIDEDGEGGDDAYDACRYGIMVRSPAPVSSVVVAGAAPVAERDRGGGGRRRGADRW